MSQTFSAILPNSPCFDDVRKLKDFLDEISEAEDDFFAGDATDVMRDLCKGLSNIPYKRILMNVNVKD